MRIAILATAIAFSSPAWAIEPFELQCSKAFDNIAESRAGMAWVGSNKARFCSCIGKRWGRAISKLEAYNAEFIKPRNPFNDSIWDCYEASDLTTKRRP